MADEIEKKYRLNEERKVFLLTALRECGAEFESEDFEENILFSNPDLAAKQAVLRLRRIGARTILTYKQKVRTDSEAKHHTEYETEIADFDEMRQILENLGYKCALVYEKSRLTWKFRRVEIVLDSLPFGEFMEIEGSLVDIAEAEMLLGIEDLEVVPETYPNLTVRHGVRNGELIEARFPHPKKEEN